MTGELWAQFCATAEREGDKTAIIDAATGRSLSYSSLYAQARTFADTLAGWEYGALAFIGEPNLDALPLVLACAAAGWCFVPISDREPAARILDSLSHLPGTLVVASAGGLPEVTRLEAVGSLEQLGLVWQLIEGSLISNSFRPFLVTHSSGSTGRPKPIAFSQATKLRRTWQSKTLFNVTPQDRILSPTPFHHSLGQRHFFLSVLTGATLIKAFPFNADLWVKAARVYSVTFSVPVATHLKILQSTLKVQPEILDSFRCLVTSSAPAEPDFKRAILDFAKFDFWEIYGMSETACVTAVRYRPGEDTSHLGRQIQGTTLRIAVLNSDGSGEIEVHSDCICDGYWGDDQRWARAMTSDGFFRSGDLGRLDQQGNLTFLSRTNESFESCGLVVFPAEIERVIAQLPQIADCIVFGIPHPVFGNLVALAYVTGAEIASRDIISHARAKLPKHLWPAKMFNLERFPMLASGKVDRQSLRTLISGEI